MAIRSFLAFELPPEIKKKILLVSEDLRRSGLNAKWVKVDNIHLTVVFMGDIKEEVIQAIKEEVKTVCLGFPPFKISLDGIGVFPNTRRPRVLWLGLEGEIERISSLRDGLQEHLKPFGIKEEKRPFKPHLTLGRFRKQNRGGSQLDEIINRYRELEGPLCRVEELIMFKSELRSQGAIYTKMDSWKLKRN
jgi:2'-5' RNA ligase